MSRGRQARRGGGMDAGAFSPGQESCRKARPRLTDLPGAARQAPRRVAFSLVTFSWPFKRKLLARRRRTKALALIRHPKIVPGTFFHTRFAIIFSFNKRSVKKSTVSALRAASTSACKDPFSLKIANTAANSFFVISRPSKRRSTS